MKKSFLSALVCLLSVCAVADSRVDEGNRLGILHLGNGAEPESLDPHLTTGVPEYQIIKGLLEGLITEDGKTLEPEPGVAESWTVSEDGTVYTFKLREEAAWSNGDPVTAHDFVFSFNRMLSPELGAEYAYMLYVIENGKSYNLGGEGKPSVKALNDQTLQVTLEEPSPFFIRMLNHHAFYPVHAPTLRDAGGENDRMNPWARPETYVGNGPFTLEEWNVNEHIFLKKNQKYWNADSVQLNGIFFYPVEDLQTEERMFRSELLHRTSNVPLSRIEHYQQDDSGVFISEPYLTTYYYLLNTTHPPLDDVRVRKALALSVQRGLITEQLLKAGEKPATWFTPPGTAGFTPSQSLDEDIGRAKRLLADAGFPGGEGFPELTLLYNTSESHRSIAQVIQQMWRRHLGIRVQLQNQEWQSYMISRRTLNFDVARAGWAGDYADPHNFLDLHLSTGGNNHTGWGSKAYDRLIRKAAGETDTDTRFEYYDQAEEILLEEMPLIPIYWYTRNYLLHPSVKGWHPNILDRHNYTEIFLESE